MLREELEVTSLSQAAEKSELLAKIDLYERELRFA